MVNEHKIKKVFRLIIIIIFVFGQKEALSQVSLPEQRFWVDSVFATLDLEQKIGQLIIMPAYAAGNEDHYQDLFKAIENHHIGGVVFLEGYPNSQVKLTNLLQTKSSLPLLIGMETEKGLGLHLDSTMIFPSLMSLGALQDEDLIYETGRRIGSQLKRMGINFNLGPSLDISMEAKNSPVGFNSFSDDHEEVLQKAKYYIKGLQESGIKVIVKSFPGMGSASVDPHMGLSVTKKTDKELKKKDFYPFRKLSEEKIEGIMTGMVYAPKISNDGMPLVLNSSFFKNKTRNEWNYEGLIFSGALNDENVTNNFRRGVAEEYSIKSGHDILLFPESIPATVRRIKRALRKGELKEEEIDRSVKRVLNFKYQAGLHNIQPIDTINVIPNLNTVGARKLNRKLVLNSITLVQNDGPSIPFEVLEDKNFAFVDLREVPDGPLTSYMRKYTFLEYFSILNEEFVEKLRHYDVVITAISGEPDPHHLSLLESLRKSTDVTVVSFGLPYHLVNYEKYRNVVWSPENSYLAQELVPQLLFGAETFSGQLPVAVGRFSRGTGIVTNSLNRLAFTFPDDAGVDGDYLIRIDSIVEEAINTKATPGAQVLIARKGKVIWEKSYGYQTYDSVTPVDNFTIYDLASITKVAASVQAVMFLYERGLIDLDKKVSYYLSELKGTNKENMILRDILTHQAGLWPYLPFYVATMENKLHKPQYFSYNAQGDFINEVSPGLYSAQYTKDSVWLWVVNSQLREKKPNEPYDYKYSDMGYYIIHRLVERIVNQPLEDFLNQNLYDPMGMTTMDFNPLCNFPSSCIAPTELDDYFRFTLVSGTVHDQGAALIGGIAGHAGLFSNALDLGKLMQLMLQKGDYGGIQYFQPETIELFTQQQYASNRRGLGWDKPVTDYWGGPTSEFTSADTYGHTGFTGTAAWVDPEFDLVYIFLSNRVHPDATNTKLITTNVRTRIQDVIYKAIFSALQYEDIQ